VVTDSGFATTSSTTAETFTRLTSLTTALVLGGSGAMLSAVTGALTVTCSTASASTTTEWRTTLDEVAVRDWVDAATRGGLVGVTVVGETVVGGCVVIDSVEGIAELAADVAIEIGGTVVTVFGPLACWKSCAVVEIVKDPMVLTVVVVRLVVGVLVTVVGAEDCTGLDGLGGVDAITNDVTRDPGWVVGVGDWRRRTCRVRTFEVTCVALADALSLF
jgi:hypothetical protein